MPQISQHILSLLENALAEFDLGGFSTGSVDRVAEYAAGRSAHLATLVDDPGFEYAVRAERDAVALFAGLETVASADAFDARMVGLIHGILGIAARALSSGVV